MSSTIEPQNIVQMIADLRKRDKDLSLVEALKKVFRESKKDFSEPQNFELVGNIRSDFQIVNDFLDYLTTDTLTESELKQLWVEIKAKGQTAITPSEVGKPETAKGNHAMVPVQSSMVKGAGAYKGMLLAELWHDEGNIYGFPTNGKGREYFDNLMESGSKGGWMWENILGKPSKFGMAKGTFHAFKDSQGQDQFFTSKGAQFVHHKGRPLKFSYNPVGYINGSEQEYNQKSEAWKELKEQGYEEFQQKWKGLGTSSELWDDPAVNQILQRARTTTQVKLEKARKAKKEKASTYKSAAAQRTPVGQSLKNVLGKEVFKVGSAGVKVSSDFIHVGNLKNEKDFQYIGRISNDFIPLNEFHELKTDFQSDFTTFRGPIVRDGSYDYEDESGRKITLHKDWRNIKDIYSRYDYLPLKVAEDKAHYANYLGFAYNFTPDEATHEMIADLVFIDDANYTHLLDKNDYHVSPGYHDDIVGDIQYILDLDHVAMSLGKERARACSGVNKAGKTCTKVVRIQEMEAMN